MVDWRESIKFLACNLLQVFHTGRPLRAPGRLLQGSFLEVSLALVGVLYLPGLIPILEYLAEECNQILYFFIQPRPGFRRFLLTP
jgi:hypothetical protein